jgi:hypothetical protein
MRDSKLTLMFVGLLAGAALPATGCFITTESDEFSDTDAGPEDDGSSTPTPGTCEIGAPSCPCTNSGTCDPGLLCADIGSDPGICVSDNPCLDVDIGTESCQCTQGGGCDQGLTCVSGLCVDLPDGTTSGTTGEPPSTSTTGDAGESSSSSTGAGDTTGMAETGSMPTSG